MQLGVRHRKEMSGLTGRTTPTVAKPAPRAPPRSSAGVFSPPEGTLGPAALASLCLYSPENGEILAFEPGILF